tara:strand:- start:316 stop:462 length:147 start_codon:yes stop_codon:yes gene_type:complete
MHKQEIEYKIDKYIYKLKNEKKLNKIKIYEKKIRHYNILLKNKIYYQF